MIAACIGHDHFALWQVPAATAATLVPGLEPVQEGGRAWLLCAAAEFRRWRWCGAPIAGRCASPPG